MKIIRILLAGLLLVPLAMPAQAVSRKTDVVTLYNGDTVTGEIKHLFGGILELSTDAMGTLKIEWKEIARLESKYNYEIRLSDGRRHYGTMNSDTRPGELVVEDLYGDHAVDSLTIVELRPIEERWVDRLDVYLSANYNYTKASSVQAVTLNTEIEYENESSQTSLTARVVNTDTLNEDTSSGRVDLERRVWTDRARLYRLFYGNLEYNDELGLERRVTVGAGLGRYFIDNNRNRFSGAFGLQAITERQLESSGADQSLELFMSGEYAIWQFDTPEMDIALTGALFPSLTESGRVRSNTDIRIRWEIIEDLFWDVSAWATYDNKANSGNAADYGISTGVGWKY